MAKLARLYANAKALAIVAGSSCTGNGGVQEHRIIAKLHHRCCVRRSPYPASTISGISGNSARMERSAEMFCGPMALPIGAHQGISTLHPACNSVRLPPDRPSYRKHFEAIIAEDSRCLHQLKHIRLQRVLMADQLQLDPAGAKQIACHLRRQNRF